MIELQLGSVVVIHGVKHLLVHDSMAEDYPYLLVNIESFEVLNGFWDINDILHNYPIDEEPKMLSL